MTILDAAAWRPHPEGTPGNSAVALVSVGGDPRNDSTKGAMATPHLDQCLYMREVLVALETVIGRIRLMCIEGDGR